MKIGLVAARTPPANDGVGDHADRLARALGVRGHEVVLLTAGDARPSAAYALESVGARWGIVATGRALRWLEAERPDALVVEYTPFLYGPRSPAPLALLTAARALRVRSAIIAHEAFHHCNGRWKARLLAWRDAVTLRAGEIVIVPGEARGAALGRRLPSLRSRLFVAPIGANVEPPVGYRRGPAGPTTIVAFGVVMPRRRLERAVDAVAQLVSAGRDVRLAILGRIFDAAYAAEIAERAERAGLGERVRFLGERTPPEISAALGAASVAVHASREGSIASSGSLLALLAHGVPTVALRTGFDDPIFDGALRYADDDEAALTHALRALLDEPAAGASLSHAAFERARACFGWPLVAERVEAALEGGSRDARLVAA